MAFFKLSKYCCRSSSVEAIIPGKNTCCASIPQNWNTPTSWVSLSEVYILSW